MRPWALPLARCLQPELLERVFGAPFPSRMVVHTPPQTAPHEAPNVENDEVPKFTSVELALAVQRMSGAESVSKTVEDVKRGSSFQG